MRKPVVALLVVAIVTVGFGVWAADQDGEDRFCTLGAYIMGTVPGLEGYSVTIQDEGDPGLDHCDGPDRPERYEPEPAEELDDHPAPSTTQVPPGSVLDDRDDGPALEPLVLGHDCRYRDVDGEVVATAVPNRSDGSCGTPGPEDQEPGALATGPTRTPRPPR